MSAHVWILPNSLCPSSLSVFYFSFSNGFTLSWADKNACV
jgi:hypothetical protein